MRPYLPLFLFFMIAFLAAGCGANNSNPVEPENPASDTIPIVNQDSQQSNRALLGSWMLDYSEDTNSVVVKETRDANLHLNVRPFIPDPQVTINSYNPATHVIDIDAVINNTSQFDVYDVRLIVFTDDQGHTLLNPDNWTELYDIPEGMPINPFIAYAKDQPNRVFASQTQHTGNLLVYLPQGDTGATIAIDASLNSNCEEPYAIENFNQGFLFNEVGSSTDISVEVFDWQDDVSEVKLHCPEITGQVWLDFTYESGSLWKSELTNNTGAGTGEYTGYLIAKSSNSVNLPLYDIVTVTVSGDPDPYDPEIVGMAHAFYYIGDLAFKDQYMYIADNNDTGLAIMDNADPSNPVFLKCIQP